MRGLCRTAVFLSVCLQVPLWAGAQAHSRRPQHSKAPALPVSDADNCGLTFAGTARASVKLRTVQAGSSYTEMNNGRPMSVAEWLQTTCSSFDPRLVGVPITNKPISGVETQKVILEGYLMAARFENDGDHDIHAEIADKPTWSVTNPHVIVEVPPGENYCAARKTLWNVAKMHLLANSNYAILNNGPKIKVTGYVFVDTAHGGTHFCTANGGRGIKDQQGRSEVKGLWEVHPVLDVEAQ